MSKYVDKIIQYIISWIPTYYTFKPKILDFIEALERKKAPIKSCIIGISKLPLNCLHPNIAHTALFLSEVKYNKLFEEKVGIIIEFGYYPPEKGEEKRKEEENIKNGQVIYRYGKELGGLRYYTNNYKNFREFFCDVGLVKLYIDPGNYMMFSYFIDKIASISEKKWIKSKYSIINFNSQDFIVDSIDILKPIYDKNIIKGKNSKVDENNIENIIPDKIKKKLKKYEEE